MLFFSVAVVYVAVNAIVSFVIVADVSVNAGVTDAIDHLLLMLLLVLLLH